MENSEVNLFQAIDWIKDREIRVKNIDNFFELYLDWMTKCGKIYQRTVNNFLDEEKIPFDNDNRISIPFLRGEKYYEEPGADWAAVLPVYFLKGVREENDTELLVVNPDGKIYCASRRYMIPPVVARGDMLPQFDYVRQGKVGNRG